MRAHELYKIDGDKLERNRKFCPKCEGSFLAEHNDRLSCGKCGYTEFKNKE
jgi:small subunit ribosomal protein S27Ae